MGRKTPTTKQLSVMVPTFTGAWANTHAAHTDFVVKVFEIGDDGFTFTGSRTWAVWVQIRRINYASVIDTTILSECPDNVAYVIKASVEQDFGWMWASEIPPMNVKDVRPNAVEMAVA